MKFYRGFVDAQRRPRVFRPNGDELSPKPSLNVVNHSPTGFNWGYHGSGPAQLALALLLDVATHLDDIPANAATRHYKVFKMNVVSRFPRHGMWALAEDDIVRFLLHRERKNIQFDVGEIDLPDPK